MAQVDARPEAPVIDHGLDAGQILDLAERRINAYGDRDAAYEVYAAYYHGEQAGMGSSSVRAMNNQGRPLLRDLESGTSTSEYRSNHLMPVVDDAQALLGRMPNSRVTPPDSSDGGIAKAQKETKFLISTHELSNMDDQQEEVGWFLPCLGDAMYMLDVEPKLRRVVWQTVDPRVAYPAFKLGYQRYDMLDVILREYIDPYEAKARFGSKIIDPRKDSQPVAITIYMSQFQRAIVVGEENQAQLIRDTRWNLPFCPAVWIFNKKNGRPAQSDIAQSLISQDALDYLGGVFLDGAAFSTYPVPVVKDPTNMGTDGLPPYGPGMAPVTVGEKGDFKFVTPTTDLGAIQFGLSSMTQDIYSGTGTSEVRQEGKLHSSIPTGRAAHALQGPQATRFELKQQRLSTAIRRLNSMTLEMQETAPFLGGKHTFDIFGRTKAGSFLEKFTPKEDIAGWYRNEVRWDTVIGMNQQQKTEMAYQAKAAGIVDDERAIEIFGEEDPPGMVERVRRMKEREAQMQQQMQGGAPGGGGPPGGGAPPGGGPPPGGQQAGKPPSMIARPPGLAAQSQPLATGVPKGVSREAVEKALQLVGDKLKGTVALVGDLAKTGEGQHIEALISDFKDFAKVSPVLKLLDPQASVKAMDEGKWPSDAVRVA